MTWFKYWQAVNDFLSALHEYWSAG